MPTSKPRITITLTDHQHALLRRISDAGGQSMSGIVSEFMVVAEPALERMATAFQQLKHDRESDHQRIIEMFSELQSSRENSMPSFSSKPLAPLVPSSQVDLTLGSGMDAIQFRASVDTIRPGTPHQYASPDAHGGIETGYEEQKKTRSRRTSESAISPKNSLKGRKKNGGI
ncbi:hypothetical protein [Nitrosospira sp. Nsp13]|uniref:hypothetical protein n=1 Tax=Nitrosospira sp. Nsp13 TaxID=1855332 RepID=UPI0008883819|nr:hypothetical protein [Nitrosospira sp. Nsp13]SCX81578.1 hypothetical protein SAMN05216308_101390 [Nitrosospira sp. Nsp13]